MALKVNGTTVVDDTYQATAFTNLQATGIINFGGTSHMRIPTGTTAERPSSPAGGEMRLNESTGQIEAYITSWVNVTSGTPAAGSVGSTELENVVTLILYDSSGSAVKTLYGAGS